MFQKFSQTTISYLDESQADPDFVSSPTESAIAIVSDNNEPSIGGGPTAAVLLSKQKGEQIHKILKLHLNILRKTTRLKQKKIKYNDYEMVYMCM